MDGRTLLDVKSLLRLKILLMQCFITFHHKKGKVGKVKGGSHSNLEKI